MQMSKFSLYSDDRQKSGLDAISDIYSILRDEAARTDKLDVSYARALNWISRKVRFFKFAKHLVMFRKLIDFQPIRGFNAENTTVVPIMSK